MRDGFKIPYVQTLNAPDVEVVYEVVSIQEYYKNCNSLCISKSFMSYFAHKVLAILSSKGKG